MTRPIEQELAWLVSISRGVRRAIRLITAGRVALSVAACLLIVSVWATVHASAAQEIVR
jgi:hypothetical protein